MTVIFAEDLDTLFPRAASPDLETVSRYVAERDGTRSAIFLAELAEELVGTVNLTRFARPQTDHAIGVGLNVGAAHRRQGIGRQLMIAGLAWAKALQDIERIELEVLDNNAPAIRLYEGLGFVHEGRKRRAIKKPFGYVDLLVMSLLLK